MFATGADLAQRVDTGLLGDLVRDDGEQSAPVAVQTHPNLLAALADADAEVRANLFTGARYSEDDLANLSTTAQSYLRRLTCDQALIYLKRRRGVFNPDSDGALAKECQEALTRLRKGETVLLAAADETAPASLPEVSAPELLTRQKNDPRLLFPRYYPAPRVPRCGPFPY